MKFRIGFFKKVPDIEQLTLAPDGDWSVSGPSRFFRSQFHLIPTEHRWVDPRVVSGTLKKEKIFCTAGNGNIIPQEPFAVYIAEEKLTHVSGGGVKLLVAICDVTANST